MRRVTFFLAASLLPSIAFAQTEEDQKIIDAWQLGTATNQSSKEAEVMKLLDAKPALTKSRDLFISTLDNAGVDGDLGRRGKKLAEVLIARGADVNGTDRDGAPLIVRYTMFAQVPQMEILLAHGAKPNAGDQDQRSALHWLGTMAEIDKEQKAIDRALAAAKLLLDKKADVNLKDKRKSTPLHLAAHNGAKAMTELLLARGADMNAVDAAGYSVLGGAKLRIEEKPGQPSFANDKEKVATKAVIDLLVSKGAKDIRGK